MTGKNLKTTCLWLVENNQMPQILIDVLPQGTIGKEVQVQDGGANFWQGRWQLLELRRLTFFWPLENIESV